jgi:hypothetical protein
VSILLDYILKTFSSRQLCGVVFSHIITKQLHKVVFLHFGTILWSCIPQNVLRMLYPYVNKLIITKWDVVLVLVFIYYINSTNEGHLLTPHFVTINFTFGQIVLSPLYVSGQFQSLPLSIELSDVPIYLLKLSNLPSTSIFLLNTNRTYAKCLKYPYFNPLNPISIQSLNRFF